MLLLLCKSVNNIRQDQLIESSATSEQFSFFSKGGAERCYLLPLSPVLSLVDDLFLWRVILADCVLSRSCAAF